MKREGSQSDGRGLGGGGGMGQHIPNKTLTGAGTETGGG